jgi:hypothetical protein
MREIFDIGVAVFAAENSVGAGGMLARIDRNAFPSVGLHSGLAMAGQAVLVFVVFIFGYSGDGNC